MLEPKNKDEFGGEGAKLDPNGQQTDQNNPNDPKAEEGTASGDELDQ